MFGALLLPATASAGASVGHSGWYWGNPLPQGNTLRALEFNAGVGFAAGDFGTLLKTDDGGATWAGVPTGITVDLRRIRMIDPATIVLGGECSVRISRNGGQTFTRLPFTPSDQNCPAKVQSFSFVDQQNGFIVTDDGGVLQTTDGGQSFTAKVAVPQSRAAGGNAAPTDVWFTSATNGVAVNVAGQIFRTTDGAGSWALVGTGPAPLNGIFFSGDTVGYAVGDNATLFKTVNGGASFTALNITVGVPPLDLSQIRCIDTNQCVISTERGDQILRTLDGGNTFAARTPSTSPVFAANMASPQRYVVVGANGTTAISDDGGETFAAVGSTLPVQEFTDVRATSASTAYAVGRRGGLARTTNAGQSWVRVNVPTSNDILDVSFPSANVGYALDSAGSVFKTLNGGNSWTILNPGARDLSGLAAPSANTLIVFGGSGVRRSTNGGNSFDDVSGRALRRVGPDAADVIGNVVFLYEVGTRTLVVSRDGGRTFRRVSVPRRFDIDALDMVSSSRGYAVDGGRVYETRTGGRRWEENLATGTSDAENLAFGDAGSGWVAVDPSVYAGLSQAPSPPRSTGGYLLRTTDAGRTWRPQLISPTPLAPDSLAAPTGRSGFVLGRSAAPGARGGSSLFGTSAGGDQGTGTQLSIKAEVPRRRRGRRPRSVRIEIDGRLNPAQGGEQVYIGRKTTARGGWDGETATVATNGTFTAEFRISRTTTFVAQWRGDDDRNGAGSRALTVRR